MIRVQHLWEEGPLLPVELGHMREMLAPAAPHTKQAIDKINTRQGTALPLRDGVHWRVALLGKGPKGQHKLWAYDPRAGHYKKVDRAAKRMHNELRTWAAHLTAATGHKIQVEQMAGRQQSKNDDHSCGVSVAMACDAWTHFQRSECQESCQAHFQIHMTKWGPTYRATAKAYRMHLQGRVRTHTADHTATDVELEGGTCHTKGTIDDIQEGATQETSTTPPGPNCARQPDLWGWLLDREQGTPPEAQGQSEEPPNVHVATRPGEAHVHTEPTPNGKAADRQEHTATQTHQDASKSWLSAKPKRLDIIGDDELNLLTWNIAGQKAACVDPTESPRKEANANTGVQVIVLTEVKAAHDSVLRSFGDMGYTAVGTQAATTGPRKEAREEGARGGVVALLQQPYEYPHNYSAQPTPWLQG
ncbi:hypothetical protein CYMTET_45209 [Cymbomonas tetramitiformis]|uniref:Uncharacterized protein n=1 Tax=Cymbomonas tetramitiformis TaxID=36881 RepID=A0AAE0EYJ0_9CHLO|nr:hypothetical protein CYMTET_45209 [Cymbomonas tetramitiformis]